MLSRKAKEIYSKIHLEIKNKKLTQKKIAKQIKMTPQTFSDNMTRLSNGIMPNINFIIDVQNALEIELIKIF